MVEKDFSLDYEDDNFDESSAYISNQPEMDENEDDSDEFNDDATDASGRDRAKADLEKEAKKHMTDREIWLETAYDDIIAANKNSKDTALQDTVMNILMANPMHSSMSTRSNILKDLFQKQGHNRMVNSVYTSDTPIRGADIEIELDNDYVIDSTGFNIKFTEEAREYIARFVGYLADRDLSKETINSRKRKEKQLPAFIIFMFSSGMYDLLINCPTMPEEYAKQIDHALKEITKSKYDVVEALAVAYEEAGRQKVADRVRQMQLSWFENEPAQLRTLKTFKDLDLTYEDVVIYKQYRSRWVNVSKAITQDTISNYIEVVEDKDAGIYYKLKDKTRSEAISDVKQVLKEWSKTNKYSSDLSEGIIWKEEEKLKD